VESYGPESAELHIGGIALTQSSLRNAESTMHDFLEYQAHERTPHGPGEEQGAKLIPWLWGGGAALGGCEA
jgi:hypothetical protein